MSSKFKVTLTSFCLSCVLCMNTYAQTLDLPEIGTAGVLGLTVQKEAQIGAQFIKKARGAMPLVQDPVLEEYVKTLGNKLLINANGVNFPFEFSIVQDKNLNAFAFLGGKVMINTGLFYYTDTEAEFASVIAHEISHITQRHIARYIEQEALKSNLTVASLIGAVAISIINPAIGAAALTTTMGVSAQSSINFTREHEYEADRLGIDLLYRSNFDPNGMVDMFKKLYQSQGNINPAFTMLIDHPLSEYRIAEAQNRARHYKIRNYTINPDFYLAKARVDVRYLKNKNQYNNFLEELNLKEQEKGINLDYIHYAKALIYFEKNNITKAQAELNKMLNLTNNIFILDLKTDIDIKNKNFDSAITRLLNEYKSKPNNKAIVINLASAYIEKGNYKKAENLLNKYIQKNGKDILAYDFLSIAYGKQGNQNKSLQSRAEIFALKGQYSQAIALYNQALSSSFDNIEKEIIKARVVELANERAFDEELNI